jgi:2TM domain
MVCQAHAKLSDGPPAGPSGLHVVEARRERARLHLFTYLIGNALFWTLWGAISVSADHWYWWPVVPLAGWSLVLHAHLWSGHRAIAEGGVHGA